MQKFLSLGLALALVSGVTGDQFGSQSARAQAKVVTGTSRAVLSLAAMEDSINLLPPSDFLAVVDMGRVFTEVLPQIKSLSSDGGAKLTKEMDDFTNKTGIDPAKIKSAVIGGKSEGKNESVAAILQGASLDTKRVEESLKSGQGEYQKIDYKGKTVYVVLPAKKGDGKADAKSADKPTGEAKSSASAGISLEGGKPALSASVNIENEFAFSQLDSDRIVAGDLSGVEAVLDAKGGAVGSGNAGLSARLGETKSGLIRFAASIPESMRQSLGSQGEMFSQLAKVQQVFGALDLSSDLSAMLDAKMRTGSRDEATQLEGGLTSLLGLGKMFLGGNQDPQMQLVLKLIDEIKIGSQASDVSVSLTVPRAVIDALGKSGKKTPAGEKQTH